MLDNTEEAACAIDFVDDSVNTQNIKVCTDDEIAPATETDNFSIQLDTPGSIVKQKFRVVCSRRGKRSTLCNAAQFTVEACAVDLWWLNFSLNQSSNGFMFK